MNEKNLYRRIARREQFRSRSVAVASVLVVLALAALYVGTEAVLAAIGARPLLVAPADGVAFLNSPPPAVAIAMIAGIALAALVLLGLGLLPSTRGRHTLADDRSVITVDDGVLASAFGRVASQEASVRRERVSTSVARRDARVVVVPTSGVPVQRESVEARLREFTTSLGISPALRMKVAVSASGEVGS